VADDPLKTPRFSRVRVTESIVAALMVTLISGTSGGVLWLVVQLPNRLQQILNNQERFETKFSGLEEKLQDHDRRIIRLELRR
jgi:predicted PurR-regulated permease PerM